jgi:hypothetical protein
MRFACWISKATHTHTQICNACFSTVTVVTRTRLDVTLYVHCPVLFSFKCYEEDSENWTLKFKLGYTVIQYCKQCVSEFFPGGNETGPEVDHVHLVLRLKNEVF